MGALVSGLLSDLAGRKMTVVIGASLCAVGGAIQTSSLYLWSDRFLLNCDIIIVMKSDAKKLITRVLYVYVYIGCCFWEDLSAEWESGNGRFPFTCSLL